MKYNKEQHTAAVNLCNEAEATKNQFFFSKQTNKVTQEQIEKTRKACINFLKLTEPC